MTSTVENASPCQLENNDVKTKNFFLAAFLSSCVLSAASCFGQSNVVFHGANTNAIAVAFVDTNLSVAVQASMVADLQLCLQKWGQNSELRLRNKGEFVGYLDNPDRNPCYPETITFPENVVSNGTNGLALQIPKALSDAYTNAFAFTAANSNIVAAAYEFIAFVSSTNFSTVSSNTIMDYVLVKGATTNMYFMNFSDTTNSLRKQMYYPSSVLGCSYSSRGPAATNLWMQVPCSNTMPWGSVEWGMFPAIWYDGKWKFCFWE